jgi:hypothetical protein
LCSRIADADLGAYGMSGDAAACLLCGLDQPFVRLDAGVSVLEIEVARFVHVGG